MMDIVTCDICGAYTTFSKWSKEDLCPDCKVKERDIKRSKRSVYVLRKIKREVKEFITFKYENDKEKYKHAGEMAVQGYAVHGVLDELTVVYEKRMENV